MKTLSLEALKINQGESKNIRKDKRIPAVIYGRGMQNEHISLEYQAFKKTFYQAGASTIIEIMIGDKKIPVLVQEVQTHPVNDNYIHIDFHAVKMDEEIHTHIPIHLEGDAPAVKLFGGIVVHGKESIEIKCLPGDLISEIKVDISGLTEIKSIISVADLNIPKSITVLENPETMIVNIAQPKVEEVKTEEETELVEEAKEDKKEDKESE